VSNPRARLISPNNVLIAIGLGTAIALIAAALNRPVAAPAWPAKVAGFAFSPIRGGADPSRSGYPSIADIDADLKLIAAHGRSVRTYAVDGTLGAIPRLAARYGLTVTPGVWLDKNARTNAAQIRKLRRIVAQQRNVRRVVVGNETILRGDMSVQRLGALLDRLRAELDVPVGTAEPWHVWLAHPELARHVDFLAVHLLPYWEGIDVDHAVDFIDARMRDLAKAFPNKPIVIGEVGWPSWGRARGAAVPSRANAAIFLRRFLRRAARKHYDYFVMEAFDQPWKGSEEGRVGAYWGVFNAARRAKYQFAGPLVRVPEWSVLAALAALAGAAAYLLLVTDGARLRLPGRLLLAGTAGALGSAFVFGLHGYLAQYWTLESIIATAVSLTGLAGIVALMLVEAHEWAEARWSAAAPDPPPPPMDADAAPKVSIHVPAYEEPPKMLLQTLHSLAALDYPRYEVLVVDNNTRDESLWRPIEAFCAAHAERFRFYHVAPLAGHKAGALNFALGRTAADAAIVAVVDSDYSVQENWLRDLVPAFADPAVAIVQAPQAYRDAAANAFKTMCEAEYRGFFAIGMVTRDAHNAIIQHGTMTMVRKDVLAEVGGWGEWTVTEDAELGLRILAHGHRAFYTPRVYGRGLTPDNFQDYKTQRFRWALGAVQVLKRHGRCLLGARASALSLRQRFHYLTGWLGWLADGCNLIFNLVAVGWSLLVIAAPLRFEPPLATFSAFVVALFAFKLIKMAALYRARVGAGAIETAGAALAGLALVFTVGRAVLAGFLCRRARFCRTPKLARRHSLTGALAAARWESLLAAALLACAGGVLWTAPYRSVDGEMWAVLLVVLAVPHLAALAVSFASALPARRRAGRKARIGEPVEEGRRS
jgi:exo-beta-1,3-glucanase (GH17 family)/cellulose synthase/poly-beta-1,6-N-acetylglucosamine synthase-like glycosyltransferase